MKKIIGRFSVVIFWLGWPFFWLYLRNSSRARILIVCGQRVLTVKGIFGGDKWLLPGGGMHRHESAQAAACREGEEELGIKLPQDQLKLLSRERFSDQGISYTEHYFLLRVDKEFDASMSFPEILDAAWTDYRTMNQVNSDKAAIRAIQLWQASPAFVTITAESQRR